MGNKEFKSESGLILPTTDAKSRTPVLRYAVERFFDGVSQSDVQQTLEGIYLPDKSNPHRNKIISEDLVDEILLSERYPDVAVDGKAVSEEVLLMNNQKVWFDLLHKSTQGDPSIRANFSAAFPQIENDKLFSRTSDVLESANRHLFGATLVHSAAAVVYGDKYYGEVIDPESKVITDGQVNPIYSTGQELAKRFTGPVSSRDETLTRLQEVFPADPASHNEIAVFRAAKQTKSFTHVTPNQEVKSVHCPGENITGKLFSAYGNILTNPDYQGKIRTSSKFSRKP
jgi:hypothetical protein